MITTHPIAVESTVGCDCEDGHRYFCVGCGNVEYSGDGKVYFYVDDRGVPQCVCWDCVRGPNPNYVRLDSSGNTLQA